MLYEVKIKCLCNNYVLHNCELDNVIVEISLYTAAVISEPDDVTVCEGEGTTFTCVLDGSVNSSDVQWYRLIEDTGITERVNQNSNIQFTTINNTLTSNLTITNVVKSHTGYYWVELPFDNICNVSLTVLTSM